MRKIDVDDKDIAMVSIAVIVIMCLAMMGADAKEIAMAAITAIAGLASGRKRSEGGSAE